MLDENENQNENQNENENENDTMDAAPATDGLDTCIAFGFVAIAVVIMLSRLYNVGVMFVA